MNTTSYVIACEFYKFLIGLLWRICTSETPTNVVKLKHEGVYIVRRTCSSFMCICFSLLPQQHLLEKIIYWRMHNMHIMPFLDQALIPLPLIKLVLVLVLFVRATSSK